MAETRGEDIVRVATARHPIEAHIWRQALETEGVHCEVVGEYLFGGEVDMPNSSELWVRRRDAELAQAILHVYQRAVAGAAEEEEEEDEDDEEDGEEKR